MKALVISDKQEIIDSLISFFKANGCDTIVYRWLLKALDNIEEIQPDLIFVSAAEYPRHWKTLASFVQSGIGGNEVLLYLYDPEPLSETEKDKAKNLGIKAFIHSLSSDELSKIICNQNKIENEPVYEKCEIAITHPVSGRFLFGTARKNAEQDVYECYFDDSDSKLEINQFVHYVSVETNNDLKSFCANIIDIDERKIVLKVKDYYEEEI